MIWNPDKVSWCFSIDSEVILEIPVHILECSIQLYSEMQALFSFIQKCKLSRDVTHVKDVEIGRHHPYVPIITLLDMHSSVPQKDICLN